jgi:stage II sporulation protein AA (anti-sigma F factor antagonist)
MARMATRRGTWRPTVSVEQAEGVTVLAVAGRLGAAGAAAPSLRAAVAQGLADARGLIVDLSAVDYLSSPGLRLLEELVEEASTRGRPLVFCGVTDPVRIAVDLAEMTARLPCAATRAEALRLLG